MIKDLSIFVTEKAIQAVHFIVQKTAEIVAWAGRKAVDVVGFVVDDIISHFRVACWVRGQYGTILPVKVFNNRALDSWIPFLSGTAMNLGGEIHIPPELFEDLIRGESERQAVGVALENNPITKEGDYVYWGKRIITHELGHQVDAYKFGPLYPILGLIGTQNPIGTFECNATERGKYYGIVPPTR